jgi:hypothetical protein
MISKKKLLRFLNFFEFSVAYLILWRTMPSCTTECLISVAHMEWCATEFLISMAHVLVRHRILIFVAKNLWSTTYAPQNTYIGAP